MHDHTLCMSSMLAGSMHNQKPEYVWSAQRGVAASVVKRLHPLTSMHQPHACNLESSSIWDRHTVPADSELADTSLHLLHCHN